MIKFLLVLLAGLFISPALAGGAGIHGTEWLTLAEIQDRPGVYIKRKDLFLPLEGRLDIFRLDEPETGFAVSIDLEVFNFYIDDSLVYVSVELPLLTAAAERGYWARIPTGEFTHINRREADVADYTIFSRPPDSFIPGGRNEVFSFGRWVGTRFDEVFAVANIAAYAAAEIAPETVRTFDGYFYLEFPRQGYLLVEHYGSVNLLRIREDISHDPEQEARMAIREAEEALLTAYRAMFDLVLVLEVLEMAVNMGSELLETAERSIARAGNDVSAAQAALIETTLRAHTEVLGMGIVGDTRAAYISAGELRAETEQALDSLFDEARDVLVEARGLEFLSGLGLAHDPEVLSLLQLYGDVSAMADTYLELLWETILTYYKAVIGEIIARQVYSEQPYVESPPVPPLRHTVAFGETLWSISLQYLGDPARWREILEYNNLRDQTIVPGQILLIPRE